MKLTRIWSGGLELGYSEWPTIKRNRTWTIKSKSGLHSGLAMHPKKENKLFTANMPQSL